MSFRRASWLFGAAVLAVMSATAAAHGVDWRLTPGAGATCLAFVYSDGRPVADAIAEVRDPDGIVEQRGRTDRAGHHCFLADRPGDWRVAIDDGLGHRLTARIPVVAEATTGNLAPRLGPDRHSAVEIAGLIAGISLTANVFGAAWWMAKRRALRRSADR